MSTLIPPPPLMITHLMLVGNRNLLAYGEKRWYLLPPHRSLYSKQPINQWLHDQLNGPQSLKVATPLPLLAHHVRFVFLCH
jgi:hypothetical protein